MGGAEESVCMEGDDGVTEEADAIYDERDIDDDRLDMVDNLSGFKNERRFRPAVDDSAAFVTDKDSRRREEGLLPSE